MSRLAAPSLLALAASLAAPSFAAEAPTGAPSDEVVVWGVEVKSDLLTLETEDIARRQADHLSDLLRIAPGVDIGGTHSTNSRINIRGLDDRELDVYIDGALQTNYLYHHLGNLLINTDILRSAEIQVGANSVTHGGVGGAVRFRTMTANDLLGDGEKNFGARLMGSYNTNAQYAGSATVYGRADRFDSLIYYYHVDRDNFEDGSGRETIGSDGETQNVLAKIGFEPTDNQRIQLSYDLLHDEGDYTQRPDMGVLTNAAITGDILLPTEYERETLNASYSLDLGSALELEATYYAHDLTLTRDETDVASGVETIKEAAADNQGVNILAVSVVETGAIEHAFTYGVQYFDQSLSYVANLATATPSIDQSRESTALFIENAMTIGRATLRPGVRYTDYEVTFEETGQSGSWSDTALALGGEFRVVDGLVLLASYTEIFQGPELAEPFTGSGSNKIVNPDLEPEGGENIEFGFRAFRKFDQVSVALGANFFQTTVEDYILETDVPGTTTGETWDANVGDIEIEGFEASFTAAAGPVDMFISHNVADFDTSGLDVSSVSESFREIGDTTSYEVSYAVDAIGLVAAISGQFIGEKTTSLGEDKEAYDVHNLSVRWTEPFGAPGFIATFGVDNLFDETYTSHASRLGAVTHPVFGPLVLNDVEPGRNVKVTLAKSF